MLIVCLATLAWYASAFIGSGVYVKALCRVKTNRRVIALTFDDGPHPVQTPLVLDVLRDNGVQAVFFCIGNRAAQFPSIIERIIEEGHLIGNHSYWHSNSLPFSGRREMKADLERCTEILEEITGRPVQLFRPPFGVTNPAVAYAVRKCGLKTIGWSVRSFDTLRRSRENVVRRVVRRLHAGAIVLLHDDRADSHLLLQKLITEIDARGYKLERLDKIC